MNENNLFQSFLEWVTNSLSLFNIRLADTIKLADVINININLNKNNPGSTNAIITPQPSQLGATVPEKSIAILPEAPAKAALTARSIPFSSGSHLRINQADWWNESEQIVIGKFKFVPIILNELKSIKVTKREQFFNIILTGKGELKPFIWDSEENPVETITLKEGGQHQFKKDRKYWDFFRYSPSQPLWLEEEPETVISFDQKLVGSVYVIKTEAARNEYFVLVVKK
jgi:hypothetical protein